MGVVAVSEGTVGPVHAGSCGLECTAMPPRDGKWSIWSDELDAFGRCGCGTDRVGSCLCYPPVTGNSSSVVNEVLNNAVTPCSLVDGELNSVVMSFLGVLIAPAWPQSNVHEKIVLLTATLAPLVQ